MKTIRAHPATKRRILKICRTQDKGRRRRINVVLEIDLREVVRDQHAKIIPEMRSSQRARIELMVGLFSYVYHTRASAPPFPMHASCKTRRYFIVGYLTKTYLHELARALSSSHLRLERFLVTDLLSFPAGDAPDEDFLRKLQKEYDLTLCHSNDFQLPVSF